MKAGLFTVSAEAPGFSKGEAKDIVVNVNARQRVDLVLQVGATKLTLNVGFRWEFATPRWERDNRLSNFDPATKTMLLAKNGSIYDRALINACYKDLAPQPHQFQDAVLRYFQRGIRNDPIYIHGAADSVCLEADVLRGAHRARMRCNSRYVPLRGECG